ncbi:MAG: hypothetical protein ACR2MS_11970 [Weeksellaceae bacterium]
MDSDGDLGWNYNSGLEFDPSTTPSIGVSLIPLYSKNGDNYLDLSQFSGFETNANISIATPYGVSGTAGYVDAPDYFGLSIGIETYSSGTSFSINRTGATPVKDFKFD